MERDERLGGPTPERASARSSANGDREAEDETSAGDPPAEAHADGTHARVLQRLARVDVLVLDDFAIAPLTDTERRDLLEVLEDRHGLRSAIITSQLDPADWHDYLADPTLADAICDRVVHGAHRLKPKGPSRRKPTTKEGKEDKE